MKEWKIAFVGMGSIGKRHFHNVCGYLAQRGDGYQIDLYRHDLSIPLDANIAENISNQIEFSKESVIEKKYDVVFITNPTSLHFETLKLFLPETKAAFIEKPVFDRADVDLSLLSGLNDTMCYVACPLRYHPVLQYIREFVDCRNAYAVRAISSSYLPDWRPNTDYRTCYSAHREMGGGVAIDLIHEWDYLTYLFGMPKRGFSIRDKVSNLEIDSDDIAMYIANTGRTAIELHLDYFGRSAMRQLEVFLPDKTVVCDLIGGNVCIDNSDIAFRYERNDYQLEEIAHFFDIFEGRHENDNSIQHAMKVLRLAEGVFSE